MPPTVNATCPPVYCTTGRLQILPFIAESQAGFYGLRFDPTGIEPESTVSAVDVQSTRPLIGLTILYRRYPYLRHKHPRTNPHPHFSDRSSIECRSCRKRPQCCPNRSCVGRSLVPVGSYPA